MPQGLLELEARLARLDAKAKQAAPGQIGLDFGSTPAPPAAAGAGRTGKPCGDGHISAAYSCHKNGGDAPQGPAAGDTFTSDEAIALTVLANKKLRSDKARNKAMIDLGVRPDTDFVALVMAAREKLGGTSWWQDESGWEDKLQRFAAAAGITPKAPAKKKQEPELISSAEVKTSADQLAFAKQQRAAARSAGDTTGEQAWADLQRDLQRRRLGAAMAGKRQSQTGLFGATDYDQSLPLFGRKDGADPVRGEIASIVTAELKRQFRQPIQLLSLNSSRATGAVTGRFRSGQMVFGYQIKGERVSYQPIGAELAGPRGSAPERQDAIRGWSPARLQAFLVTAARMDSPRPGQRRCATGYRCGSTCISRSKRCELTGNAQALGRLGALVTGGQGQAVTRLGRKLHGPNDRPAQLLQRRDALLAEGRDLLSRRRDDGNGTLMEFPTPEAMRAISTLGRRIREVDRELHEASGENPNHCRWQKGTPGLEDGRTGFPAMPDSPGRKLYREQLIQEALAKGTTAGKGAGGRKVAIVMMGGPASGKSSLLAKVMADTTGYVKVDPDEVKDRLPEFALAVANSDKLAAARAHEESSTAIAEKIKERAIEGGYNVMLDGTGKNGKKYLAMVQRLKERGYEVRVIMPHISVAEGVMAAEKRAHRSGRFVPLDFIRQAYEVIPHNFEQVARLADSAVLADAEPDRLGARSMSTIQRWEKGRIVEEDQSKSRAYKQQFFGGNAPR